MRFLIDFVVRCAQSFPASIGTNGAGLLLQCVWIFAAEVIVTTGVIVGLRGRRHLKSYLGKWRIGALIYILTLLVGYGPFFVRNMINVRHEILDQAASQIVPTVSSLKPPSIAWDKAQITSVPVPARKSRLQIYKVSALPLANGERRSFALSVSYVDSGNIPATVIAIGSVVVTSDKRMASEDESRWQKQSVRTAIAPAHKFSEIMPGVPDVPPQHFFSVPDKDEEIASLSGVYQLVLDSKVYLYLFVTMKYQDTALPPDKMRVSEFCAFFIGTFDIWHDCGGGRTYIASR